MGQTAFSVRFLEWIHLQVEFSVENWILNNLWKIDFIEFVENCNVQNWWKTEFYRICRKLNFTDFVENLILQNLWTTEYLRFCQKLNFTDFVENWILQNVWKLWKMDFPPNHQYSKNKVVKLVEICGKWNFISRWLHSKSTSNTINFVVLEDPLRSTHLLLMCHSRHCPRRPLWRLLRLHCPLKCQSQLRGRFWWASWTPLR